MSTANGSHTDNGQSTLGVQINDKLLQVHAKILATPQVNFKHGEAHVNDASWAMVDLGKKNERKSAAKNRSFISTGSISILHLFVMNGARLKSPNEYLTRKLAIQLQDDMIERLKDHGYIDYKGIPSVKRGNIAEGDVQDLDNFLSQRTGADEAVLLAMQKLDQITYARIKWLVDMRHRVNLVCMIASKIERKFNGFNQQFLSNFSLKFNIKSEGISHRILDWSKFPAASTGNTIVMGAEVAHPAVGEPAGVPSVAAVVGSIDGDFQQYPGSMRLQAGKQEATHAKLL